MKKLQLITIAFLCSFGVFAQNEAGEKVLSLNIGYSLTGGLLNNLSSADATSGDFTSIESSGTPAIAIAFDYGIGQVFSIGAMYSFQQFSGDIRDYNFTDLNGADRTESINYSLTRSNLSILPRLHYKLKTDKVDLYSGFRIGYIFWGTDIQTTDPSFDVLDGFNGGRLNVGVVPIGTRFYFNENFGGNIELAIGAPYIASIGAQYRF